MKRLFHIAFLVFLTIVAVAAQAAPAGQLDPTFGVGGIRAIPFDRGGNQSDQSWATAQGPDGRIYLAGQVARSAQTVGIGIARLLPDTGELDGTFADGFGQAGRSSHLPAGYKSAVPHAALVLENGLILVAGTATATGATSGNLMVCMFDQNGGVVTGFGSAPEDGCAMIDVGATGEAVATGITLDPQGNIVIAGYARFGAIQRGVLARMYRSGEPIDTFGNNGIRFPQFPDWVKQSRFNAIALSPDSRLLVVGAIDNNGIDDDFLVVKFNWVTGGFDNTFHGDGFRHIPYNLEFQGENNDEATDLHVLPDNSLIVAGNAQWGSDRYRPALAKLTAQGDLVPGFGGSPIGKPVYPLCEFCDKRVDSLLRLNDGKLVFGGTVGIAGLATSNDLFVTQLDSNGVLVAAYGGNPFDPGTARVDITGDTDGGFGLHAQGQRVLLGGFGLYPGVQRDNFVMIRLDHGLENQPGFLHSVTPNAGPNGSVSPNVVQQVVDSGYKVFTLTPDNGFSIGAIQGNCPGSLINGKYYVGPVTGNCQFTANFVSHVTLTYLAEANGSIVGPTPQTIPYNTDGQPVEAVADEGYKFLIWSDGYSFAVRQDISVTENIEATAIFAIKTYTVTPDPGSNGALLPGEPQTVAHDTHTAFVVQPDPGYGVLGYKGCEGTLLGHMYVTGPVTEDCDVEVEFVASNAQYTLSYAPGLNCAIEGQSLQVVGSGFDGSPVKAVAQEGHFFVQWSDGSTDAERQDTHVFDHIDVTALCVAQGTPIHTVTPVFGLGGALSPHVPLLIPEGYSAEFQVVPNPGHEIKQVTGCGAGSVLIGAAYTTEPVTADCEVEASFTSSGSIYSLDYAAGLGGSVQGELNQQVVSGGSGTPVTAVANPGRYFVQWSDGNKNNPRQDQNVIADVDVAAQFAANGTFIVESAAGPNGAISPEGIQVVDPGAVLQFTVTPDAGFAIVGVEGCGGQLVGKTFTTAPIDGHCKVQAVFVATDQVYLLKYAAGPNGSILGQFEQVVPSGGTGTPVTALPADGYLFLQWSDGSTQNPRTDEGVIADVDVTAQFVLPTDLVVTPGAGLGGTISPSLAQVVEAGDVLQFTILPNPGFAIASVEGTCGGNLEGKVYTTAPIAASCTVEASFVVSDAMYTLTYAAGANGSLQGELDQQVVSGGSGTPVTAVPNPGFFFVQWSDGSQENPRTDTHVISNISVTAQFALNGNFVVTPVPGPGGALLPVLAQVVAPGGTAQFTVAPNPGFVIESVSGCGGGLAGNIFTTGPVQANCQVVATFKSSNAVFQLTYLAGPNGSLQGNPNQQVPAGGSGSQVTAVPNAGFFFLKWSDGSIDNPRLDANVTGDITVTAQFVANGTPVHIVTASAGPGGAVSPDGPQPVVEADNAVFTILPNPGFGIASVEGTCDGSIVGNLYVTAPVLADCGFHVAFQPSNDVFTLSYTAGANGLVNGQAQVEVTVPAGGQGVEVEAQPAPGFFFVQWTDGGQENPRLDTNVAGDIKVTAQFAADGTPVYTVIPLSGAGGAWSPPIPQHIAEGGFAQFTVKPNPGFAIDSIGGTCGGSLIGNLYTTHPVAGDCTVEVDFVASDEVFTLIYIAGPNGLVNGQNMVVQNVPAGGEAEPVQAQPAPGFFFLQWTDGWQENPRQDANVVGDAEVTAQFAQNGAQVFVVTPIPAANGGISPMLPMEVVAGGNVQFALIPNEGYVIESVGGTCGGTLDGDVFTTNPVFGDCTVEPAFLFNDRIFYNGFGFGDEQQ